MRLWLILCGCLLFGADALGQSRTVWIDADPACGVSGTSDVDDCWAIVAAIRSARLNVIAVSTIFGNSGPYHTAATTEELLAAIHSFEPRHAIPPIHGGATRPLRRNPGESAAVTELERTLERRRLTILALGPLTNIALLLQKRPGLVRNIEAVVAVAGQRPGQVFKVGSTPLLHFHDLNVRQDADAFDIVLRSGVPLHLVPFEVARRVSVRRADLNAMSARGKLDRWIAERSLGWLEFWERRLGAAGFSPFDSLAAAYLHDPALFLCERIPAKIVRRKGLFVVRDTLEVGRTFTDGNPVTFCPGLSRQVTPEDLLSGLSN